MTKQEIEQVKHNLNRGWVLRFIKHCKEKHNMKVDRQIIYRAMRNQNSVLFMNWLRWATKEIELKEKAENNLLQKIK